jgi:hypothetical protein
MQCPNCLITLSEGSTDCFSCGSTLPKYPNLGSDQTYDQTRAQAQTQFTQSPPNQTLDYRPFGQTDPYQSSQPTQPTEPTQTNQPYQPYSFPEPAQPTQSQTYEVSDKKPNYYQPSSASHTNPYAIRKQLEAIEKRNQYRTFGIVFLGIGVIVLLIGFFMYLTIGEWIYCGASFIFIGAGIITILTNLGKGPVSI